MLARAALIFLIAAALRTPRLGERPMHADEAVQAAKLDEPRYDPRDYHGPVLLLLTPARYATATEAGLRTVPAVAGALLGALPGPAPFYAGLFVALSPAMVWYSRDYIPEILLVLWTYALIVCGWLYGRRPSLARAAMTGAAAGLMIATKETAVIALACAALVWARRIPWRHLLAGVGAMVLVAVLLLRPSGFTALAASYGSVWLPRAVAQSGHVHGFFFYAGLLARTEWPILVFGAIGGWRAPRFAVYAVLVLLAYSFLPYKTPWCALTALHGIALAAGYGAEWLVSLRPRAGLALLGAACLVLLLTRAEPVWSYVETSPELPSVREKLRDLPRDTQVQVISDENVWPLPWYLRDLPQTRFLRAVPTESPLAPVILTTPGMEPALVHALYELPPPGQRRLYTPLFDSAVWIRPGLELRGYRAAGMALGRTLEAVPGKE